MLSCGGYMDICNNSHLCSASVKRVFEAISCCTGPCYNGTQNCIVTFITLMSSRGQPTIMKWHEIEKIGGRRKNCHITCIFVWVQVHGKTNPYTEYELSRLVNYVLPVSWIILLNSLSRLNSWPNLHKRWVIIIWHMCKIIPRVVPLTFKTGSGLD